MGVRLAIAAWRERQIEDAERQIEDAERLERYARQVNAECGGRETMLEVQAQLGAAVRRFMAAWAAWAS